MPASQDPIEPPDLELPAEPEPAPPEELPGDDGYAALAASEDDEDRAFHEAMRRRVRDRRG